jgi:hypothetical protein
LEDRVAQIVEAGGDILDVLRVAHEMAPTNVQMRTFAFNKALGMAGYTVGLFNVGDKVADGNYGGAIVEGGQLIYGRINGRSANDVLRGIPNAGGNAVA